MRVKPFLFFLVGKQNGVFQPGTLPMSYCTRNVFFIEMLRSNKMVSFTLYICAYKLNAWNYGQSLKENNPTMIDKSRFGLYEFATIKS